MAYATLLLSLAALATSVFSVFLSRRQGLAAIRSELLSYARSMGSLDRKAARVNGHQIGMLGRQVEVLINEYGQKRLRLPASYYRIVADYLALATDELTLASELCGQAERILVQADDPLEEIRVQRVRVEIAGREADLEALETCVARAVEVSEQYTGTVNNYAISKEALARTYTYALFSALLASQRGAGAAAHQLAEQYFTEAQRHGYQDLFDRKSLEIARRAQLIHDPDAIKIDGLSVHNWKAFWSKRNKDGL